MRLDTLCVAWADSRTVQVTTDPSGPASGWKPTTLAPDTTGQGRLRIVSCATTKVCLAGSGAGLAWSFR
ncbi:MAG: hypothetical protein DLM64_08225 [Solirubrobacterales bacterium]|nr:MAG: hypothetical protein DLM63_00710 [Solirubrobacterales bacterium]PZS10612.1 MAG: hypothetical protein DLM64_08225 [Solirubrobacterales bacterium]